jgi:hypothetical protein
LIECNPSEGSCVASVVATHDASDIVIPTDGVCQSQTVTDLRQCPKGRYSCQITGGNNFPPTEDAFIEWYWAIEYSDISSIIHFITGKFTFCASASYIFNTWTNNGGTYINPVTGFGIPIFNPSNHNV